MYQNWIRIRRVSDEALSPFWRTVFAPVTAYGLFARIHAMAEGHGIPTGWNANVLATLYLALSLAVLLPDPWWLISLAVFAPMLPVQRAAQQINARHPASATEPLNTRYGAGNIVTIVVGGLVFVLLIIAFYVKASTQ
jgi:hypothetical protein